MKSTRLGNGIHEVRDKTLGLDETERWSYHPPVTLMRVTWGM